MHTVDILFNSKKYSIAYSVETFTVGSEIDSPIINIFTVFLKEPSLIELAKEHFTLIYDITHPGQSIMFNIQDPANTEEKIFKQIVAKAILKNYDEQEIGGS